MSDEAVRLTFVRGRHHVPLSLDHYVDAEVRERAAIEANAWIKALRHVPIDGLALRDRFRYRDDSLWWFAELYLHKEARIVRWLEAIHALERSFAAAAPQAIEIHEGDIQSRYIIGVVAKRHRVPVRGAEARPHTLSEHLELHRRAQFYTWSAHLSRARRRVAPPPLAPLGIAAFVHSAFWRRGAGEEGYIGPVLDTVAAQVGRERLTMVGVGPRVNFRAWRWWHGVTALREDAHLPFAPVEAFADARAIHGSLDIWRRRHAFARALLRNRELREATLVAGHDLWPLVAHELRGVAHLQWPWSARAMDEAGAALDALKPSAVATYAEAGGWGRAIVLEARRRGIRSAGLQHGFIYRHWLNYRHEPDEMEPSRANPRDAGFPRPTLTLLFDKYGEMHLRTAGHFPPASLAVVGSARLDALAATISRLTAADREQARRQVGAAPGDAIVLVATKYTQVHRVFRRLAEAIQELPEVRLVVKCHPAETPAPYERDAAGLARVVVAHASADLARLIAVARAVVTVNSTVAIDALVLGIPSLIVDLPNNLSPFVEAGVMAGALTPTGIRINLAALVRDTPERTALLARREAFLAQYDMRSDGCAAERAAEHLVALTRQAPAEPV